LFCPASARPDFHRGVPNLKISIPFKKKKRCAQNQKNVGKFSGFEVPRIRNGGSGKISFILFIFLAVLDLYPDTNSKEDGTSGKIIRRSRLSALVLLKTNIFQNWCWGMPTFRG